MSLRSRLAFTTEPLYIMDGTAFIFRGFYAFQSMTRSDGFPTNALFIVTRTILKLLREEKPAHFVFVMDGKGPNFRHELFPAYKAQRGATPEPLVAQFDPIHRVLAALGVPVLVSNACEADDCIASLAARYGNERPVVIIGMDKDLKQCLTRQTVLWDPAAKEEKLTTLEDFRKESGMEPSSWPDYQAIIGDSSDNIPGIPGIGPKTAAELFPLFSSLEEIRDRMAAVPPKIRKKLEGKLDDAFLYRKLTTLRTDVCADSTLEDTMLRPVNANAALDILAEFELRALTRELTAMLKANLVRTEDPEEAPSVVDADVSAAPQAPFTVETARETGAALSPVVTATAQASLFDVAPVAAPLDFPAASLAVFAGYADKILAIVPHASATPEKDGFILACENDTHLFTGSARDLVRHLTAPAAMPALCVTPDLKKLCAEDAAWEAIPVARWFDLSLAAYLLNPEERDYSWPRLLRRWEEPVADTLSPAANPGRFALKLREVLASRLRGAEQDGLMMQLEMPLIPVLRHMEKAGIRIDNAAFASFLAEVQTELDRLNETIHHLAGGPFNIRSSQQLGDVLFSRLGLPSSGKTKGGLTSTSQETLEKLIGKHPVIEAILAYRTLEKLRSTYLEPLPRLADGNGRIHTTFNLLATATGRLSSSNPNLQNIPVRGQFGPRMRACFIAPPGRLLVSADYSQVELRVLAHMAQDPILTDAFRKGEDIHSRTASLLFDLPQQDVTPEQRRHAKTINFGLIYGMGPQKLGQDLGISVKEARAFIDRYFERLGALRVFYDAVEKNARACGFVTTITGRRRYIPDIMSENNQLRSQARRQAINARVQGSAADIIKIAMLAIAGDKELAALDARLLLQVHDELVLEAPEANAKAAGARVAALMAAAIPPGERMEVPLGVEWGVGATWNDAH